MFESRDSLHKPILYESIFHTDHACTDKITPPTPDELKERFVCIDLTGLLWSNNFQLEVFKEFFQTKSLIESFMTELFEHAYSAVKKNTGEQKLAKKLKVD